MDSMSDTGLIARGKAKEGKNEWTGGVRETAAVRRPIVLEETDIQSVLRKYNSKYIFLEKAVWREDVLVGQFKKLVRPYTKRDCGHLTVNDCVVCVSQLAQVLSYVVVKHKLFPELSDISVERMMETHMRSGAVVRKIDVNFRSRIYDNSGWSMKMRVSKIRRSRRKLVARINFSFARDFHGMVETVILL